MPTVIGNSTLTGLLSSVAGGQLIATTKGALIGNNGTQSIAVAVGPDGSTLVADSTTASGLGWIQTPKNNFTATRAPLPTDDSTAGYSIGSEWINTTTGIVYIASSVTPGAAVWNPITGVTFTARNGLTLTGSTLDVAGSTTILSTPGALSVNSTNTAGQVLQSSGTVNTPAVYGAVNLANTNAVTGVLPIANGGTGATTFTPNSIVAVNASGTGFVSSSTTAPISGTVTTTTNTPTTLLTIPTTLGNAYSVQLVVVAKAVPIAVTGYLSFREFIGFANILGTVNINTPDALIIYGPNTTWTVTLVPSGSNLLVQVTGATLTTINWSGTVTYLTV